MMVLPKLRCLAQGIRKLSDKIMMFNCLRVAGSGGS